MERWGLHISFQTLETDQLTGGGHAQLDLQLQKKSSCKKDNQF